MRTTFQRVALLLLGIFCLFYTLPSEAQRRFNTTIGEAGGGTINLTGIYIGDDQGICYIQQTADKKVYLYAEHPGKKYSIAYQGDIKPSQSIQGLVTHLPKYSVNESNSRIMSLKIKERGRVLEMQIAISGLPTKWTKTTLNVVRNQLPGSRETATFRGYTESKLTGIWKGDGGIVHYVTHRPTQDQYITWMAESTFSTGSGQPGIANVFFGKKNGDMVQGNFMSIPKGIQKVPQLQPISFRVESAERMRKVSGASMIGVLNRPVRNISGIYIDNHNGSCFIQQTVDNEVFLYAENPVKKYSFVFKGRVVDFNTHKVQGSYFTIPKFGQKSVNGLMMFDLRPDGNLTVQMETIPNINRFNKTSLRKVNGLLARKPPEPSFQANTANNLDGYWKGGQIDHYMAQYGNTIVWFAESEIVGSRQPEHARVFFGQRNGSQIRGAWANVPKGKDKRPNAFALNLTVTGNNRLVSSNGAEWNRIDGTSKPPSPPRPAPTCVDLPDIPRYVELDDNFRLIVDFANFVDGVPRITIPTDNLPLLPVCDDEKVFPNNFCGIRVIGASGFSWIDDSNQILGTIGSDFHPVYNSIPESLSDFEGGTHFFNGIEFSGPVGACESSHKGWSFPGPLTKTGTFDPTNANVRLVIETLGDSRIEFINYNIHHEELDPHELFEEEDYEVLAYLAETLKLLGIRDFIQEACEERPTKCPIGKSARWW